MATENAVMAAVARARRDHDHERRLRAARAGPLPLPRLARRADRGHRVERAARSRASSACAAASTGSAPEHIEVASFIGLAAVTGGDITIDDASPDDLVLDPARLRAARRARRASATRGCACRRDQELVIHDDLGGQIPKIEDGPWPAFPADLTSIALAVATQAQGDDPDLREDVREPAVLRRQARLDGRADHPLRPAPRDRERPGAAVRPADVEPRHPRRDGAA